MFSIILLLINYRVSTVIISWIFLYLEIHFSLTVGPYADDEVDDTSNVTSASHATRHDESSESNISSTDDDDRSFSFGVKFSTDDEESLINNNGGDATSLLSTITNEINNENNLNHNDDESDRWSNITHITDDWPEGNEETSSDEGYASKSETDSSIDNEEGISFEIHTQRFRLVFSLRYII